MIAPLLPPLGPELIADHERAHDAFAEAFEHATPEVVRLFVMLQRRLVEESIAYVQPVHTRPDEQVLVPAPRGFLTETHELRMEGANAVFRHLDGRAEMKRIGVAETAITPATPYVFHALLEGPAPSGVDMNPGMLRAYPLDWTPEENMFMHPPGRECPALVEAAMDLAMNAPAPHCVRAAYLTFAMLSIHPFADGNGRTSRALYMAVAADGLRLGMDWGALEQWSVDRTGYIDALQAGQRVDRYRGGDMDATAFVRFATVTSTLGAHVCRARLDYLGERVASVVAVHGIDERRAAVVVAAQMLRVASRPQLAPLAVDTDDLDGVLEDLLGSGRLTWALRPPSMRTRMQPDEFGLVVVG
jgi:hypothetical protein